MIKNTKSCLLIAGVAIFGAQASADLVWAVDNLGETNAGTVGDRIVTFDSADPTGTITTIGSTGVAQTLMGGLAFDGSGNLYTGDSSTGGIWSIDQTTGAATLIGASGSLIIDLAWDNTGSRMLGLTSTNQIISIDLATGAGTVVSTVGGSGVFVGLTVDSAGNGFLHDLVTDSMFTLDIASGTATQMSSGLGVDTNFSQGMGTNWANGDEWFVATIGNTPGFFANNYTIDPTTGAATLVDSWPFNANGLPEYELGDLDFAPVPEPATMAVLGLGALALLRRRNKK